MINPLRGMKDLTFDESARFVHIIKTSIDIAKDTDTAILKPLSWKRQDFLNVLWVRVLIL